MKRHITISLAEQHADRAAAHAFISEMYRASYDTEPPESHIILVAREAERITGTIGLDSYEKGALRLEHIYDFSAAELPLPYERPLMVEFGRWVSTTPKLSPFLLYAATHYAHMCGKRYGWCEHHGSVHRIARQFGIRFYPIHNAHLILTAVPATDRAFYLNNELPHLYMVTLDQAVQALEKYTKRRAVTEGLHVSLSYQNVHKAAYA